MGVKKTGGGKQNRLQHTTTIYLHPEVALFAAELTAKLPPGLDVAYFTNSGTEANDLAILLARCFTRNFDLLALRHAYHGGGGSPYGATAHATWRHAVPAGFGVRHVACPDAYRGAFSGGPDERAASADEDVADGAIGLKYARELQETIDTCTPGRVAGFLHESIQGVGGVRSVEVFFICFGGGGREEREEKRKEDDGGRRKGSHFFLLSLKLSLSETDEK
jgi:alanine-glyoxylate transaminase/(R)-3-amino-2-methylpropionate-pyruvate transaminase